jgi:thioredoxin reductase (NADPH)
MIERLMPGGQVASTDWVENYPGFEEGIAGWDLVQKMEKQAKRFGLEIVSGAIDEVNLDSEIKRIRVGEKEYEARTVIVATGMDPRLLGVPGEKEFKGRGVSYCATCDGPFFKDKEIVVVGGGSSGIQESLFLSRFTSKIQIIEIMEHLNAEKVLQERAEKNPKLSFLLNHEVVSINGDQKVESVTVKDRANGKEKELRTEGVFIWVGFLPNTGFLKGKLELSSSDYIVTGPEMETSVPGVFAAGDVRAKKVRQISTAVGDGTVAAESAIHFIEQS